KTIRFFFGFAVVLAFSHLTCAQDTEATSDPLRINLKPKETATPPAPQHRFHALLIAVEEYQDQGITPLSEPLKDAMNLKQVLTEKYTFEEENVSVLKNPTFEELSVAFEQLVHKIQPTDHLLIFYAGHGYFDEKTNIGYWLPSDARKENRAKWFRNSALVENIGAINSKHTLLIADACFSGGIFKHRAPFNNASPDIYNMMKRASRKAMTSGALTTVPDKSVFMKYLLKTLNENENKFLPDEYLFDEIRLAMRANSTTRPLYGEIHNVGDEGGNFVLIRREQDRSAAR
ncbi:MAG TPA: caspase family protein, partial [Chryseosolibacter sp.]|nr:caspase family protein [Chryseosolibacter sp.]